MPLRKTVREGERALLVNKHGQGRLVDGPQRVFVINKRFECLPRFSADQKQYLRVKHRDGTIEHMPGPCSLYQNPHRVDSVEVKDSYALDANEVLVVYQRNRDTGGVERRVQNGPTVFTPSADEWLHEFVWHGTDPNNKTKKVPGALRFTKLRVIPDQFYFNIEDVRTKDDALIKVKLMVFFELRDIETMLNQTTDPISDFINAVQADVIAFASQLTYEEFMDGSGKLNSLEQYPQLRERSKKIGYEVTKVVFRGYHAGDKLQRLHDHAIEKRTHLKVKMEAEQQKQDLTDSTLLNEQQRSVLQQSLQLDQEKHKHTLEKEQLQHQLRLDEKQQEEQLDRERSKRLAELEAQKKLQDEELAHLAELKRLGVDLTKYLETQNPKPDQVLRIITQGGGSNVHIHP